MTRASEFQFDLPPELVAQHPLDVRDASRLLHVRRPSGTVTHRMFREFPELLRSGDLLVLNDTRVFPARVLGKKVGTGGRVELLLCRPVGSSPEAALASLEGSSQWVCLGQASKGLKAGAVIDLAPGLEATIVEARGEGEYLVRFSSVEGLGALLARHAQLPLPPYITRAPTSADDERYQTVFGARTTSVAAPTAGLHFSTATLEALRAKGVRTVFVTLDVGPGTFLPVRVDDVSRHVMHAEHCEVPAATAEAISATRAAGGRVVAVGTTVVRTLETFAQGAGGVASGARDTQLFILPGFRFQVVDALLTNFHLPQSTLLMLVSAFLGREATLAAYRLAVEERYRFFSYGDAMFIEDDLS